MNLGGIFKMGRLDSGNIHWALYNDTLQYGRNAMAALKAAVFSGDMTAERLNALRNEAAVEAANFIHNLIRDQQNFKPFAKDVLRFEGVLSGLIKMDAIDRPAAESFGSGAALTGSGDPNSSEPAK